MCRELRRGRARALAGAASTGSTALLRRPLADARAVGLTDRAAPRRARVITASYEYHGGFRLRTLSALAPELAAAPERALPGARLAAGSRGGESPSPRRAAVSERMPANTNTSARLNAATPLPVATTIGSGTAQELSAPDTRFPSTPPARMPALIPTGARARGRAPQRRRAARARARPTPSERAWYAHGGVGVDALCQRSDGCQQRGHDERGHCPPVLTTGTVSHSSGRVLS